MLPDGKYGEYVQNTKLVIGNVRGGGGGGGEVHIVLSTCYLYYIIPNSTTSETDSDSIDKCLIYL